MMNKITKSYDIFHYWENLRDIHKGQQSEEYSHATVWTHRKDWFGPKLLKRTPQTRVCVQTDEKTEISLFARVRDNDYPKWKLSYYTTYYIV